MREVEIEGNIVTALGHDSIKIKTKEGMIIYFDPFANPDKDYEDRADVVFVSHEHFDHCSLEVIKRISYPKTTIIAPKKCGDKIRDIDGEKLFVMPGEKVNVKNIEVEVVHAYNTNKPYHPKGEGNGYVVNINGTVFYHPGDTDAIEEMKSLKGKVDVYFVPISGTYVMDIDDAIESIEYIKPKIVIPIHYNYLEGLEKDPKDFEKKVKEKFNDVEVIILIE